MEVWKDVINYEGFYQVSNFGNVRSLDRIIKYIDGRSRNEKGKVLNPYKGTKKYLYIDLKGKSVSIQRLVAIHFLENPENKPTVNHIDGNKSNNHVDNLEWNTFSENNYHAWQTGLRKPNKRKEEK